MQSFFFCQKHHVAKFHHPSEGWLFRWQPKEQRCGTFCPTHGRGPRDADRRPGPGDASKVARRGGRSLEPWSGKLGASLVGSHMKQPPGGLGSKQTAMSSHSMSQVPSCRPRKDGHRHTVTTISSQKGKPSEMIGKRISKFRYWYGFCEPVVLATGWDQEKAVSLFRVSYLLHSA